MLDDFLKRGDGKTLEFKRDVSSSGPIARTLCAFSNTAGGTIVFGVEDKSRAVFRLGDPLGAEERIASLVSDTVVPRIAPKIEITSRRGKSVILVTVFPGPVRPYHVRSSGPETGTYIRVGSSNRRASTELIAELARTARNVTFDEEPLTHLGGDSIDLDLARARFEGTRPLRRQDLRVLRVVTMISKRERPTKGGYLLFGRDRLEEFPDARIRAARFAGSDRSRILDRLEINTDLVAAIDEAAAFVARHSSLGMEIRGTRRTDLPEYPAVAVREAVVNAVAHADYSQLGSPIRIALFDDRLEIENPGLLPFGLTIEEIFSGISKLRNRVIGRAFNELGLIEEWGSGIQRILSSCGDAGAERPTLEEIGTHFRVTLFPRREGARPVLAGTPNEIVNALSTGGPLSTSDLSKQLGVTDRTARKHLRELANRGLVVEIGQGPRDPHKTWALRHP